MESRELALLKKIKLQSRRKLNTLFMGEYRSAFKGMGLAFESVREYNFGDDVRSIDWNVSARMNHLYVKEFVEERELSVVLMVDVSGSQEFGSARTKRDLLLETVTLFLYLAQMNNDSVTVILFSDSVEKVIKPLKGRKYILKVLDEIMKHEPGSRGTDISAAVDTARRILKKRSIVFVISDFLDESGDFSLKLRLLSRKHDIIPVQISDPLEKEMKFFGLTEFVDLETGKVLLSDSLPEKGNLPAPAGFETIMLNTDEGIEMPILKYFEKRNRTRHIAR
ncbi:MAG TPA: DUF58 domain-containing protein [Spirochaetota bacterium]|nr:DUF58 domain-containing protein [Spirochaetota bacterium]